MFPFTEKGVTYSGCYPDPDYPEDKLCATEVDASNFTLSLGVCGPDCPLHEDGWMPADSLTFSPLYTEDKPKLFLYPRRLRLTSTGPSSDLLPDLLGLYQKDNSSHSGRPVWRCKDRDDGRLAFDGKMFYVSLPDIDLTTQTVAGTFVTTVFLIRKLEVRRLTWRYRDMAGRFSMRNTLVVILQTAGQFSTLG